MRPKKHQTTGSNDLFRARLDQIINLKHELVLLAGKPDWDWIDGETAGRSKTVSWLGCCCSSTLRMSDEGVCERRLPPVFPVLHRRKVSPHAVPHERSGLSHWRKRQLNL